MKKLITTGGIGLALMGLMLVPMIGQQRSRRRRRAVLTEYCLTCHSDNAKTGGLTLEQLDIDHPETNPEIWEKVVRKLRCGNDASDRSATSGPGNVRSVPSFS